MGILGIYCQCCANMKNGKQKDTDYNTPFFLTLTP